MHLGKLLWKLVNVAATSEGAAQRGVGGAVRDAGAAPRAGPGYSVHVPPHCVDFRAVETRGLLAEKPQELAGSGSGAQAVDATPPPTPVATHRNASHARRCRAAGAGPVTCTPLRGAERGGLGPRCGAAAAGQQTWDGGTWRATLAARAAAAFPAAACTLDAASLPPSSWRGGRAPSSRLRLNARSASFRRAYPPPGGSSSAAIMLMAGTERARATATPARSRPAVGAM